MNGAVSQKPGTSGKGGFVASWKPMLNPNRCLSATGSALGFKPAPFIAFWGSPFSKFRKRILRGIISGVAWLGVHGKGKVLVHGGCI